MKIEALAEYYGDGRDELHLAFNFPFITAPLDGRRAMRRVVEDTEDDLATRCVAGLDGLEPRHVPVRLAVGGGRSHARSAWRW